ncbi:oxidoreductase [Comamonas testosteroni]|uniref:Oxidoreductase n=1 Tax=Comamonas testosteroni TaxID=285 RepID=A0A373FNT5_COMTE|nr:PDR/VanB family oxidoreductase [Comamonas testosteroni]RGE45834.1 oxidoreductase [Comamonas testosteroni]
MTTQVAKLNVRVARKIEEAQDICMLELASLDGSALPGFSAGSHVDVFLPNGLVRQYSLCNHPQETDRYQIAVLRCADSRGGSTAVHDLIKQGDTIAISAPRNNFALQHEAQKHLLLAGGIGITPLLSMAERLSTMGADFELHYAARSMQRMAFVSRIRESAYAENVKFYSDDAKQDAELKLDELIAAQDAGTHLYVCGPTGFMNAVLDKARALGWADDRLHREFFGAEVPAVQDGDEAFEVQLASSGKVVQVPVGVTVIHALTEAGVEIPYSCEQGVCGTCLTRVLEGTPDHRDMFLTEAEQACNDQFTPCCSRSRSVRLVLDI